jgi:hypothetical protein
MGRMPDLLKPPKSELKGLAKEVLSLLAAAIFFGAMGEWADQSYALWLARIMAAAFVVLALYMLYLRWMTTRIKRRIRARDTSAEDGQAGVSPPA